MSNDKDIDTILSLLPQNAIYYFTKATIPRALDEEELRQKAVTFGFNGNAYPTVKEAFDAAKKAAAKDDFIFVGGSNFVVADFLLSK